MQIVANHGLAHWSGIEQSSAEYIRAEQSRGQPHTMLPKVMCEGSYHEGLRRSTKVPTKEAGSF